MSTLYDVIKSLCDEKGVTGAKMCNDVGLNKGLMTGLKMGRRQTITTDTAQKIADYFGVSVERVLGSEQKEKPVTDNGNELSENKQKLIDFIREIPEDRVEMIFRVIRSIAESD